MRERPIRGELAMLIEVIELTRHAIERYRERLRRGLSYEDAELDLVRLMAFGRVVDTGPTVAIRLWRRCG